MADERGPADGAEQRESEASEPVREPEAGHDQDLRRNDGAGVVTGVCAGLAEYTRVDPVVWRVAFAITALAGGTGLWLYIAAWVMMRDSGGGPAMAEQMLERRFAPETVLSLLTLGLAAATALSLAGGVGWGTMVLATPLILGLLSAHNRGVDLRRVFRELPERLKAGEPPPVPPTPEPAPSYYNPAQPWAAAPSGPIDLAIVADRGTRSPGEGSEDTWEHGDTEEVASSAAERVRRSAGRARENARSRRERRKAKRRERGVLLFGPVLLAAVAAAGVAFALTGGVSLAALLGPGTGPVYLGSVVLITGAALLVGARVGNPRGLALLGTLTALLLVAAASMDLTGVRVGAEEWRPAAAAGDQRYHLTAGTAELDLSRMTLQPGDQVEVDATVRLGRIEVLVPETARVAVRATAAVGGIRIDGSSRSGVRLDARRTLEPEPPGGEGPVERADRRESRPSDGEAEPPLIIVDLKSYGADMEVRRVTP